MNTSAKASGGIEARSTGRLFADCVLPGCDLPVEQVGQPCPDCLAAFGDRLQRRPEGRPLTAAEIEARDAEVEQAYADARRHLDGPLEGDRRQNQTCWLCQERHTCTRRAGGWECDSCQDAGEVS